MVVVLEEIFYFKGKRDVSAQTNELGLSLSLPAYKTASFTIDLNYLSFELRRLVGAIRAHNSVKFKIKINFSENS